MKILVVSDIESKFIWDHFDPERFRDVKMIISCGDLSARYLSFLVTMIPCPLFYVPGNHDKKYEREPPEGCVNIDGRVIEYKGVRLMGLGGCKSPHPCLYEYSDEQMPRKVKRLEPQIRRSKGIDLFVTHAPRWDSAMGRTCSMRGSSPSATSTMCINLPFIFMGTGTWERTPWIAAPSIPTTNR